MWYSPSSKLECFHHRDLHCTAPGLLYPVMLALIDLKMICVTKRFFRVLDDRIWLHCVPMPLSWLMPLLMPMLCLHQHAVRCTSVMFVAASILFMLGNFMIDAVACVLQPYMRVHGC